MTGDLTIRYEWKGADDSDQLDLRHLGHSLLGIERIAVAGLSIAVEGAEPKRWKRVPVSVHVTAVENGSFEVAILLATYGLLALDASRSDGFLSDWIMGVINRVAGRRESLDSRAMDLLEKALDIIRGDNARLRQHIESREWQRLMAHSARQAVTPVGKSCDSVTLTDGFSDDKTIDEWLADEVREASAARAGNLEPMRIRVDGFSHHNQILKVVHPLEPGRFITARVLDPEFEATPNVYVEAAARRSSLDVMAKAVRKEGVIQMLYIMDAHGVS